MQCRGRPNERPRHIYLMRRTGCEQASLWAQRRHPDAFAACSPSHSMPRHRSPPFSRQGGSPDFPPTEGPNSKKARRLPPVQPNR
ncbi:MAG: hypothetical protein DBX44_03365 [Oscillospiraceae bacterium]|nr:MAG: hypothetical protein DBX44_03365 [Oscillospiraceae bacterium]